MNPHRGLRRAQCWRWDPAWQRSRSQALGSRSLLNETMKRFEPISIRAFSRCKHSSILWRILFWNEKWSPIILFEHIYLLHNPLSKGGMEQKQVRLLKLSYNCYVSEYLKYICWWCKWRRSLPSRHLEIQDFLCRCSSGWWRCPMQSPERGSKHQTWSKSVAHFLNWRVYQESGHIAQRKLLRFIPSSLGSYLNTDLRFWA